MQIQRKEVIREYFRLLDIYIRNAYLSGRPDLPIQAMSLISLALREMWLAPRTAWIFMEIATMLMKIWERHHNIRITAFLRITGVSRYQNVSILVLIKANNDGGGIVTTGYIRCAKLQSNSHQQQTNTQLFTCRMPFLSVNRKCQKLWREKHNIPWTCSPKLTLVFSTLSLTIKGSFLPSERVAKPLVSALTPIPQQKYEEVTFLSTLFILTFWAFAVGCRSEAEAEVIQVRPDKDPPTSQDVPASKYIAQVYSYSSWF